MNKNIYILSAVTKITTSLKLFSFISRFHSVPAASLEILFGLEFYFFPIHRDFSFQFNKTIYFKNI